MIIKTNKNSLFFSLRLLGLYLLLLVPYSHAETVSDDALSNEQIFNALDSGAIGDVATIDQYLAQLKNSITVDDLQDYLRLQRAICWNSFDIEKREKISEAIEFANLKLTSDVVANSPITVTDLKLCRAFMYQMAGDVDLAIKEYDQIIAESYLLESPRLIADSRSLRGALYSFQGNFTQALEDLITAQNLYESLNLEHWALYNLSDLATSYRRFGDPQTAIKYYKKLIDKFMSTNDTDSANGMKTEIGFALEELGEDEAALAMHLESYLYWKKSIGIKGSAHTAINVAGALIKLGRIKEAGQYLKDAEQFIDPSLGASYSFMRLYQAQVAVEQGQFDTSLAFLDAAKQAFIHIKNARGLELLYQIESDIYANQQDWQQAFNALKSYIANHKQLDNTQQTTRTTEMRTRFNTEQIERENQQLIELQKTKENELYILKQNKYLQMLVIILGCIIMVILSIFTYKQSQKSKLLSILALTDHLTQLPNRRYTYSKGDGYFKSKDSNEQPLSLILFDADHFKKVNDQYGHDIGDKVLIALANISNGLMRKQDLVGRVGGEEFLVILPGTTAEQALNIAQRLVTTIESGGFEDIYPNFKLTISAGVATYIADKDFNMLLKRADKALYQAKSAGRNCAILSTENAR
ncbi:diguanylate cyclase [Shewanella colwelliana]|uniref:tetratricopeptide repeat-containing diguanylate cyclase n=1 Tax=Shewanella colwelliana TaxID=23 RepID=UPI0022AF076A|nr:diguanylate cyclase [Shewanella colwelliana]MCZ4339257.1 diguanylate cyclase [Shewanella colwelliana]